MSNVHTNCIRLFGYFMISTAIMSLSETQALTDITVIVTWFLGISILYLQHRTEVVEQRKSTNYE